MKMIICKDHQEASRRAADLIAEALAAKPDMTLTLAAGDTPFACYRELISRQESGQLRLTEARYIGLDEWVGLGPETPGSCIACMNEGYYNPAEIPREQISVFDGRAADVDAEIERMRNMLEQHPLELAVLGIGVDGHVGFNEPGTPTSGDFSPVPLSQSTQEVGKKYFSGNQTPAMGATITVQALQKAGRVVVIATGENKREVASSLLAGRADLPASAFFNHPDAYYIFDEAAAGRPAE